MADPLDISVYRNVDPDPRPEYGPVQLTGILDQLDRYGRNLERLCREAVEGPNGNPFEGFPHAG